MTGLTKGYWWTGRKHVNGQEAADGQLRFLFCDLLCWCKFENTFFSWVFVPLYSCSSSHCAAVRTVQLTLEMCVLLWYNLIILYEEELIRYLVIIQQGLWECFFTFIELIRFLICKCSINLLFSKILFGYWLLPSNCLVVKISSHCLLNSSYESTHFQVHLLALAPEKQYAHFSPSRVLKYRCLSIGNTFF